MAAKRAAGKRKLTKQQAAKASHATQEAAMVKFSAGARTWLRHGGSLGTLQQRLAHEAGQVKGQGAKKEQRRTQEQGYTDAESVRRIVYRKKALKPATLEKLTRLERHLTSKARGGRSSCPLEARWKEEARTAIRKAKKKKEKVK